MTIDHKKHQLLQFNRNIQLTILWGDTSQQIIFKFDWDFTFTDCQLQYQLACAISPSAPPIMWIYNSVRFRSIHSLVRPYLDQEL